ncbi:AEC family transporter [Mycetocola tolaasinivorans]|uniref:AEC family transporter n=1 Tax=Mycetocola tolaasinivorans TaxID=76635 RepID=A0A3L7A4P1_9MICO|nr:AEC family transporter [Mycetocola tolaasinivorans]RLP74541.1 AEC family transporter [Mycetocola tolaasinivorans]
MGGVLTGFGIIAVVIFAGYLLARSGAAGPQGQFVLNRVAFFVATPALLFYTLAHAEIATMFSSRLPLAALSAFGAAAIYLLLSPLVRRGRTRTTPELALGALGASLLNANNIGLPVALYVFGNYAEVVPVLLFQLLILNPIILIVLDLGTSGKVTLGRVLSQPFRNPMVIASMLGVLVAVSGIKIPDAVYEPFHIIGGAAIPMILIAFGMSLHGSKPLAGGEHTGEIILASLIKVAVMPALALGIGSLVLGIEGPELAAAVMIAALPTAQNVYNFASRYNVGLVAARDTVLLTTVLAVPALSLIAALMM